LALVKAILQRLWAEFLLMLRVLGRLPLMDDATHTGGRRPRSVRGGNRGPSSLGGAAGYGDSDGGGIDPNRTLMAPQTAERSR